MVFTINKVTKCLNKYSFGAAKAKSQGVNVALSVVPGSQHDFPALSGRAPEADQELARIAAWYRAL